MTFDDNAQLQIQLQFDAFSVFSPQRPGPGTTLTFPTVPCVCQALSPSHCHCLCLCNWKRNWSVQKGAKERNGTPRTRRFNCLAHGILPLFSSSQLFCAAAEWDFHFCLFNCWENEIIASQQKSSANWLSFFFCLQPKSGHS